MDRIDRYRRELSDWDDTTRRRKITLTNPVFIKGLALAPMAIAATNLKNSLILCIAVFLLLTPTRVVTNLITRKMSVPLKTFFYPLISAIIFAAVYWIMYKMLGKTAFSLGVYLPLLVVDPLIVKNFERSRVEEIKYSFINGMRNTGGFVFACLILGSIREILGFGTLLGVKIMNVSLMPMAKNPFGGFLIIGVISAFWHMKVENYHQKVIREVAMHDTSD
jgi:electron transport complex protein RnfE